jgi:hypothetical protein
MAFAAASAFMALDPRVTGALQLPAAGVIVADLLLFLLAAATVARWSKRDGWGSAHRFALATGAVLTYAWCGLVFTGRDAVDLAGQTVVAVLAVGLLAVAAHRIQVALPAGPSPVAAHPVAAAVLQAAPRP